jgi:hypothetical protein
MPSTAKGLNQPSKKPARRAGPTIASVLRTP